MSRIVRRDMLKVLVATAAGAAVSGTGIESVLATTPAPGGGGIQGLQPASPATLAPKSLPTTPFTTYQSYPGHDFDAGGSGYTWSVVGSYKAPTNGGFYFRRLQIPQAATLTECIVYLLNPTANVSCFLNSAQLGSNVFNTFGAGTTSAPSASVQTLQLGVTPTFINNTTFWYTLDVENGIATDNQIWGARVGWLKEPGLTLFPDPRRIINGGPFASGAITGPYDATLQYDHVTPTGIPAGATAAFCAVQSYVPGVLTLFPDLTIDPGIANYSGTGTQGFGLNMVYMMVPLSAAGKFKIHSYISGNCYVDAWGYVV